MNALGATLLTISLLMVAVGRKRWAVIGFMIGTLYITQGQQLLIGGLNLYPTRFVELVACVRVFSKKEFSFSRITSIDKLFVVAFIYSTIVFLLHAREGQAKEIGMTVDAILTYFAFRGLIGTIDEFKSYLRTMVVLLLPYALLVWYERMTLHNPFSSMGGVVLSDWMREGKLRCQGSFRHPSLLGTLGAAFFPMYVAMLWVKAERRAAILGILACLAIVAASNSGGPASSIATGAVGWLLWGARRKMKVVRRLLLAVIVVLALVMKSPIWFLFARLSSITGGDGWHRSYLMDIAFQNFHKWWLGGMDYAETVDWFPYHLVSTGAADITNVYILLGINGGLLAIILFIAFLVGVFSRVGRGLAAMAARLESPAQGEYLLWGLGVALAMHAINLMGITYFDQSYVIWYMHLAVCVTLGLGALQSASLEMAADVEPDPDEPRPVESVA